MARGCRKLCSVILVPTYIAIGLAWLTGVINVVVGRVIIRETSGGSQLAHWIERLPTSLARCVFTALWCLFFLGWIIPFFLGARRFFRSDRKTSGIHARG